MWIIGYSKNSKLFTTGDPWYLAISCKVSCIFNIWLGSYKFLIEIAVLCASKIQMMFEFLWITGLEKNCTNFTVEYTYYLEIFGKVSWILDVDLVSYQFVIEIAMFRCIISVTIFIYSKDLLREKLWTYYCRVLKILGDFLQIFMNFWA